MISSRLLGLVRCPDCHRELDGSPDRLTCRGCGRVYESPADFLDMRPREQFAEQTKYLDDALHVDARHERVSPPLLGSKIRNDMLRSFLAPAPGELVVDLGCGSGRALLWNRGLGATTVGIDIAPFFSHDARGEIDLLLGDLRRLPFADATFDKAWSLDVLEHLSPEALAAMLKEAARVLKPGGSLFVYTHVRKNAPIAPLLACKPFAARRKATAARFTPGRVRLDFTRPPVFFTSGHRPGQLQKRFTVANLDTSGPISLMIVNAVSSLTPSISVRSRPTT